MLEKCYDNKMAKLPGDPFYRDHHMRIANKKIYIIFLLLGRYLTQKYQQKVLINKFQIDVILL